MRWPPAARAARSVAMGPVSRIARRTRRPLIQILLRPGVVVEVGQRHPRQPRRDRFLDAAQIPFLLLRHQGKAEPVVSARAVRPTR
jgi:hypothetical protein